jgi:hypothetical protein
MKAIPSLLPIIFVLFFQAVQAEEPSTRNIDFSLYFQTGVYPVDENLQQFITDFQKQPEKEVETNSYRIIQFDKIPDRAKRNLMAENGITLYDYIPNMAYYAGIAANANLALLEEMKARSIIAITPEFKLDFDLYTGDYPEYALRGENAIALFIHFFPEVNETELIISLSKENISMVSQGYMPGSMLINAPIHTLDWLVSLPYIIFIEPIHAPPVHDNYTARTQHRSSNINSDHPLGRHYDGSGVSIMLQDDGVVGPHIDYQGRIGQQFLGHNWGDHGDHIAGTLVGSGNLDPTAQGMASGATLYVYGVTGSGYQGFNLIPTHYDDYGIRITSTSYSDGCNAGYTSLSRSLDNQVRIYPSLLHVFSSGNNGTSNCGYGAGSGWGNITGGHKAGKNVIAVGNLNLTDGLAGSSSRGPAHDGRIKPEVTAKGSSVYSTTNPNSYTSKSGTSMACPGVSGTLTQLYHAYRIANNDEDPLAGLMKGILMNSADDLGNPGPDFKHGYGRINGLRAARTIEEFRFDSDSIEQGEIITHMLEVPDNVHELRIMLYWTDYEATTGATRALVNDLNLQVNDSLDNEFLPWILDHTPNAASLDAPAIRGVDSINNAEQVTIQDPLPGTYSVTINGTMIPQGPQQYFITWEFITGELSLDYPAGGESFVPGESEMIRWNAVEDQESFGLEYSTDNGNTWTLIDDDIDKSLRYHNWTVPYAASGQVWVRLSHGEQSVTNEHAFSIIGVPENLQVEWACEDAFRLVWDEVYGASSYTVRKLGEDYMDSIATTSLNSYIFSDIGSEIQWLTVNANGEDGAIGRRAYAIQKPQGTFNCKNSDLALESIPSASWMVYHPSHDLTEFPVEVLVRNIGATEIAVSHVGFSLDEQTPVLEPVEILLQPDSSLTHQFFSTLDFSEPGNYRLKTWVYNESDENPLNDTLLQIIRVLEDEAIQPNPWYNETFDDFEHCMNWPICEQYTCALEYGWVNYMNIDEDDADWRTYGGTTPTGGTGPSFDHTTGTVDGNYLYLEASLLCFNKEALLLSPCFDLSNAESANFSFWYHMYGMHTGRLHVDAYANGNIHYNIVPPIVGERGDEWKQVSLPLDDFLGSFVTFRFRGVTGPQQLSDIAIDDVEITMVVGSPAIQASTMHMQIYPNPGTGIFTLDINVPKPGIIQLKISDLMGKTVYSSELQSSGLPITRQIDLSTLPSGIYFLNAGNSQGQTQQKIVKH